MFSDPTMPPLRKMYDLRIALACYPDFMQGSLKRLLWGKLLFYLGFCYILKLIFALNSLFLQILR